jgi:hypothetical protein
MNQIIKRHPKDKRIVFINKTPTFRGIYTLNKRQVNRIAKGYLHNKSDEFIETKLDEHIKRKEKKSQYHTILRDILSENENAKLYFFIKLGLIEDMISKLRKEKTPLKRQLKNMKNEFLRTESEVQK